jgi:hypothetical protein
LSDAYLVFGSAGSAGSAGGAIDKGVSAIPDVAYDEGFRK